jgi:mannose-6-phosphate isomerase-like protein (cupin superfamily)
VVNIKKSYLIEFDSIGSSPIGFISIGEAGKHIPFEVKRVFWTYFTPESIVRGRHAHYNTEQVLIAVSGRILVTVETADAIDTYVLERPNVGVYVPPNSWHTMQYSHSAVQLVLASTEYDEKDYIRNYDDFKRIWTV